MMVFVKVRIKVKAKVKINFHAIVKANVKVMIKVRVCSFGLCPRDYNYRGKTNNKHTNNKIKLLRHFSLFC